MKNDYFWEDPKSAYIENILENDLGSIFLTGPTGCGKSELLRRICDRHGGYLQKNLRGEDSISDFVGQRESKDGETFFNDGVLPLAMKEGKNLILDEVDACPPDILFTLQPVLNGNELVVTKNAGEIVKPSEGFHLLATGNTKGRGDETGLYKGTRIQNEAFLDRWDYVIEMDYPPEFFETNILEKKTGIEFDLANRIVISANNVRDAFKNGEIMTTISVRRLVKFAESIPLFGLSEAFKKTILNRMSSRDKDTVHEIFQRVIGGDISKISYE
jgi:cobaltochelatase CobS